FLASITEPPIGCVLTDVRMPGINGIDFIRALRERNFAIPVIVMTGHADVPLAVQAMKEGAVDFLEKPFDDERLLSSIRSAVARGAEQAQALARKREARTRLAILSEREAQVLEGLVSGKPNKVIARELAISPRTVEIHRANLMTKLQANSLSELVRLA